MIEIKDLIQKFGDKVAVEDVNLRIQTGRITGLIGPNGSGKSTIIRSIMGILKPTKGSIYVDNELVNRTISKKIAYMSDINELYLPTLKDNIDYHVKLYKDYDVDLLMDIINSLNLKLDTKIKGLSKGETTITRFALTFARKVNYYLLDEPLSGLDPVFRESFIERLRKFREANREATIVITSHMLREIEDLLDDVIAIYFAKILAHDSKENILKNSASLETWFKEQYINAGIKF